MDTRKQPRHQTITASSRPQATCSPGNWCLLPGAVHRRGLWKRPHRQTVQLLREVGGGGKARQRSRTVRHNRAARAEVTTPYPGPRFPPGRYSGTLWNQREAEGSRSSAEESQPEEAERGAVRAPGSPRLCAQRGAARKSQEDSKTTTNKQTRTKLLNNFSNLERKTRSRAGRRMRGADMRWCVHADPDGSRQKKKIKKK